MIYLCLFSYTGSKRPGHHYLLIQSELTPHKSHRPFYNIIRRSLSNWLKRRRIDWFVYTLCSCSTGVHLSSSLQILNHIIGKKKCPANEYATTSILLIYIVIYFETLLIYQSELSVCLPSRNTLTNYHNVFSHFMIKYNLIIFGTYFNAKICWLPHVKHIARLFFLFVLQITTSAVKIKKIPSGI